ncbi:hypothetical protein CFOL_v3_05998 [Cephalotus follicularis]|uniref:Uncharacterized protein n=1 Tax=Cephalotus follicularis TaxID=3775 RepID=A0A1Q3B3J7_CEPFO|nr:hypothetical protein CFOL_v3_05998 [Cephalotus follicularis]
MPSSKHELPLPQKSLQIKQDDKFFSRLMAKEASMGNSSCRIYYGGASGAIPFMWESQPGTPKEKLVDTSLPPLTPPPSFYSPSKSMQNNNKPNLLSSIFPRFTSKKSVASPPSSRISTSSSSSSSSSSSWSSSPYISNPKPHNSSGHSSSFSCSRSAIVLNDDEHGSGSPTSTLCFGDNRKVVNGFRGCYPMVNVKKALLSIVGHGSNHGTA